MESMPGSDSENTSISDESDMQLHFSAASSSQQNLILDISPNFGNSASNSRRRGSSSRRRRRETENVEYIHLGEIDLSLEPNDLPLSNSNRFPRNDPVEVIDLCTPPVSRRPRQCRRSAPNSRSFSDFMFVTMAPSTARVGHSTVGLSTDATANAKPKRNVNAKSQTDKGDNNNNSVCINKSLMCAVCLENFVSREPTATKCGHIFCKNCISEAIRLTHKCPVCQARLRSNYLLRLFM